MTIATRCLAALTLGLMCVWTVAAQQPAPLGRSVITVPTMDCAGCAKKVVGLVQTVPGVGQVTPNVEARALVVLAQPNVGVSPRGLWDAVQKAGYVPSKLESPYGVFTTRPQN
jgi:copper chaperone CopZ